MGITQKLIMGEQSFLYVAHHPDLIHIPEKFHEDIPNSYRVIGFIRFFSVTIIICDTSWSDTHSYKVS